MKTEAIQALRAKLAADQPTHGLWITLESPNITELAVELQLDWIVIDAEHGHLDWKEIVEHLRATNRSSTVALVRIAELNTGLVKRALDCGADGIVFPWIETADQLREARATALYPPEGKRGIGGERATMFGLQLAEHTAVANQNVLLVPIIETVRTLQALPAMCEVPGIDLFYFGPADFSSTAGYRGQWEGPGVAAQILDAMRFLRQNGKQCGVIATSLENLAERRAQGFRLLGLGSDIGLLARVIRQTLASR
jgi:2-dehydro-3-deoxyglucarate aldolase/4-hydroxy-2-oxoheptanedioate aldolase